MLLFSTEIVWVLEFDVADLTKLVARLTDESIGNLPRGSSKAVDAVIDLEVIL